VPFRQGYDVAFLCRHSACYRTDRTSPLHPDTRQIRRATHSASLHLPRTTTPHAHTPYSRRDSAPVSVLGTRSVTGHPRHPYRFFSSTAISQLARDRHVNRLDSERSRQIHSKHKASIVCTAGQGVVFYSNFCARLFSSPPRNLLN
jgi:hypothetical protein